MADDLNVTPGSGAKTVTDEVSRPNGVAHIQGISHYEISGSSGSKTGTPLVPAKDSTLQGISNKLDNQFAAGDEVSPKQIVSDSAPITNVTASTTSAVILTASVNRTLVILHNLSSADLYLGYGQAVVLGNTTAARYTYKIPADATWEMPQPIYRGDLHGAWTAVNGRALITQQGL